VGRFLSNSFRRILWRKRHMDIREKVIEYYASHCHSMAYKGGSPLPPFPAYCVEVAESIRRTSTAKRGVYTDAPPIRGRGTEGTRITDAGDTDAVVNVFKAPQEVLHPFHSGPIQLQPGSCDAWLWGLPEGKTSTLVGHEGPRE